MKQRVSFVLAVALTVVLAGCSPSTDYAMAKCINYMYYTALDEHDGEPDQATKDSYAEWAPRACEESLERLGADEFVRLFG